RARAARKWRTRARRRRRRPIGGTLSISSGPPRTAAPRGRPGRRGGPRLAYSYPHATAMGTARDRRAFSYSAIHRRTEVRFDRGKAATKSLGGFAIYPFLTSRAPYCETAKRLRLAHGESAVAPAV